MRTRLRKVGNSRGIIVPAALVSACNLGEEVELRIKGNTLVIEAARSPRKGWFEGYRANADPAAWSGLPVDDSTEDWTW
jgi:antitoxin MazE